METIDNYLDTMFSIYPYTPQTIEAKAELRAMMEDAYNGAIAAGRSHNEATGQALSEFGNIEEVASGLGLTPLHGTSQPPAASPTGDWVEAAHNGSPNVEDPAGALIPPAPVRVDSRPAISVAQARNFATVHQQTRWMLGWGVAIFVLAPIPLVSLNVAASDPSFFVTSPVATIIGLSVLLPLIAVGVGLLVWRSQKLEPFTLITQGTGRLTPEVEAFASGLKREHFRGQTIGLIVAVGLWVLSALPIIAAGILTEDMAQMEADGFIAIGLACTLALVATGLLVFLPSNWANSAASHLTESALAEARADSGHGNSERYPAWVRAVFAGYWLVMVAIYLSWSFISGAWDISWIIWPIAGVTYAAFAAIIFAVFPNPYRT